MTAAAIEHKESKLLPKWLLAMRIAESRWANRTVVAVAMHLLERYNEGKGKAWPSYEYLAKRCGVSRSNIVLAVDRLIEHGVFERLPGRGKGFVNEYRPNFAWGHPSENQDDHPSQSQDRSSGTNPSQSQDGTRLKFRTGPVSKSGPDSIYETP